MNYKPILIVEVNQTAFLEILKSIKLKNLKPNYSNFLKKILENTIKI